MKTEHFVQFLNGWYFIGRLLRFEEVSQSPQIKVPYPPPNGGQQCLGTLKPFCPPIRYIYTRLVRYSDPHCSSFKQRSFRQEIYFVGKVAKFDASFSRSKDSAVIVVESCRTTFEWKRRECRSHPSSGLTRTR